MACLASSGFGPATDSASSKDVCDNLRTQSSSCIRGKHVSAAGVGDHNHSWRGRATFFSQKPSRYFAVRQRESVLETETKVLFTPETGGSAGCAFCCRALCRSLWGDMDCGFHRLDCQTVGLHRTDLVVANRIGSAASADTRGSASHHAVFAGASRKDISG